MSAIARTPYALLGCLFFVSGASSLIFEILWIRALGLQFGTTAPAVAAVLAAFMAGLAIGNLWIGPWADRRSDPLALYARLELGIAVSGLAVTLLLLRGDAFFDVVAAVLESTGPAQEPLRFALFCGLLLVPTVLMGGTLPLLSRALAPSYARGRVIGVLYAVNTSGAVAGALLPDLLLVPTLGLAGAAGIAAFGNLAVALGAGRLATAAPAPVLAVPDDRTPIPRLPLVLFGVSGFAALGLELLWSRAIQHWAWGDIASFSVLLAVYLVAISVGAALTTRWADQVKRPVAWAATLLVGAGLAVVVGLVFADRAHTFVGSLLPLAGVARPAPEIALLRAALLSGYLEGPTCLLLGAAFPFLAAAVVGSGPVGRRTGVLYAVNTLAGVAGSILTCFVLMPAIGVQASLLGLALLMTAAGVGTLVFLAGPGPKRLVPVTALGLVAVLAGSVPPDHLRHTYFDLPDGALIELSEGPTTTAAAARGVGPDLLPYFALMTPGVYMSSTGFAAQRYMSLMAQVPLLFSKERTDALLICFGAGNTARALLAAPQLERLDVVDISPEVISLSKHFASVHGGDPLDDPRVTVHVDDGRRFLGITPRRYDVITLEPPPPGHAGVVNLYSREYYATAKAALKPDGVLAQWLPVFQLAPEETVAILASIVAEFPHTALFQGIAHQWYVLGSLQPLEVDVAGWDRHLAQPSVAAEMARVAMHGGTAGVLATFMVGDATLREAAASGREITDDFPSLQYSAGALATAVEYPALLSARPQEVLDLVPGGWAAFGSPLEVAAARRAFSVQELLFGALRFEAMGPPANRDLVYGTLVRPALELDAGTLVSELLGIGPSSVAEALRRLKIGPDSAATLLLARRAFYTNRWADVLTHLDTVDPAAVGAAHYWLLRGGAQRGLGQSVLAATSFRHAGEAHAPPAFRAGVTNLAAATEAHGWAPSEGPLSTTSD